MLDFITAHNDTLNLIINAAMLVVWVVYLQLLVNGYRRQRRSSILITRGAGHGMRSRCLITNMSVEPVYVTSLIATLVAGDRRFEIGLTDMRDLPGDLGTDPRSSMRQGSLKTGQYLDVGHFDELTKIAADREDGVEPEAVTAIEIIVVALYGSLEMPVGAERHFEFHYDDAGKQRIVPTTIETRQHRSRLECRNLRAKLASHL